MQPASGAFVALHHKETPAMQIAECRPRLGDKASGSLVPPAALSLVLSVLEAAG